MLRLVKQEATIPKLRNAGSDIAKLTQWLGRKCRNHHPLEELGIRSSETLGRMYKAKIAGDLSIIADEDGKLVYMANGRCFTITVEEVAHETFAKKERVEVGY